MGVTIKALPGHPARPDAAHVLYEVTKERGTRPHFQVVDVAVQGLVHSEDELRHAAESPPQGIQKSLRRHYARVRVGTKTARRFVDVTNNQRSANHPPATFGISASGQGRNALPRPDRGFCADTKRQILSTRWSPQPLRS